MLEMAICDCWALFKRREQIDYLSNPLEMFNG